MSQPIIGLVKALEDPATGVTLGFHVVRIYQVDVVAARTLVTLSSFASRAAHDAGKNPVAAVSVSGLAGAPAADPVQWCYAALMAEVGDQNALSGAVAAYAAEVAE